MLGTIEFMKSAGCLSTGEYPLIETDADMDPYVVKSYDRVMFVEDVNQTIAMPSFEGWSECNMVRLTNEAGTWKAYYWITDARRSSDVDGATEFALMFNPVTTLLKKGDALNGQWLRSPVNYTPWKQQNVASGTMGVKRTQTLLFNMPQYEGKGLLWVSVTATKSPAQAQGSLEIYGFPICASSLQDIYDDSSKHVNSTLTKTLEDGSTYRYTFPTLHDLLSGSTLAMMGLTASEILDISVTPYSPFLDGVISGDDPYYYIKDVDPILVEYDAGDGETAYSTRTMYCVTSTEAHSIHPRTVQRQLELSEEEIACGQISVMKGDGTVLFAIPTNWTDEGKLFVEAEVVCDFTQCIIRVMIRKDTYALGETPYLALFSIPCDHIPYTGNMWDNYRAYSMSYDRDAMEFSIEQAKENAMYNVAKSALNVGASVATGNMTGAAQGTVGIVDTLYGTKQATQATRFNQALTERRVQAQPGNAYNANYGIFGLYMSMMRPLNIAVSMPVGLTSDIYEKFIEDFGYSNEGRYEQTIGYGFYQGTVYSSPTKTGPRFAELINAFNAGIRLIKPSGK